MEEPSIFDLHYVLSSCATMSPDEEEELRAARPTLNLLNVKYEVKERIGPWWKGACFRPHRTKTVIHDFTAQFRGGEIVAILGSSGMIEINCVGSICFTRYKAKGNVIESTSIVLTLTY